MLIRKSVVLVPCPGADPLKTWVGEWEQQLWATDGIRKQAPAANIMTYDHGDVKEEWTLKSLSTDLLRLLFEERSLGAEGSEPNNRPLFFICHSIGGLVVKLALTEAYRHPKYRSIAVFCHGVTFFATPHQGSIHLFMEDFRSSIQDVLDLKAPLPVSLTKQLNLDDPTLQRIDQNFKQLVGEFQLWSFYETEDSILLSSGKTTESKGIPYRAPITTMRSAILGVRHETVYALRSTHAECVLFEDRDRHTLKLYLRNLCTTISKVARIYEQPNLDAFYQHQQLNAKNLESKVMIEVHGFYESKKPTTEEPVVRLLFIKQSLQQLLSWGPDALLEQRLSNRQPLELDHGPMSGRGLAIGRTFVWRDPEFDDNGLSPTNSTPKSGQYLSKKGRAPQAGLIPTMEPHSATKDADVPEEPRSEHRKFDWIHVPFNNPVWVEKVFEQLSVSDKIDYAELFSAPHWDSRHTRARHPQHHACFLKPTCGTVSFQKAAIQDCRYLYLPYLHFDTYKAVIKRRNFIRQRLEQGRTHPVPSWVLGEESLELKLLWVFLGHDPPINCRRTLDQYQYPSIHDTRARDDDQVLYKLTKESLSPDMSNVQAETPEDDVLNGNLLMVDQLWMWIMETPDHKCKYAMSS